MPLKFQPRYQDGAPLEAEHLDDLAAWTCTFLQNFAAALIGVGSWGILHAEDPGLEANEEGLRWPRHILLSPSGLISILNGGRLKPDSQVYGLDVSDPERNSCESKLVECVTPKEALIVLKPGPPYWNWPVAFLGSTPTLRKELRIFLEELRATLKAPAPDEQSWRTWLMAAASFQDSTPVNVALPFLEAFRPSHPVPAIHPGWPRHEELLAKLREVTNLIRQMRNPPEPDLRYEGDAKSFAARPGRLYRKRVGAELTIEAGGLVDLALAPVSHSNEEGKLISGTKIAADWQVFVVRWPPGATATLPLSFRDSADRIHGPI